jgi:hypothetical protein
MLVSIRFLRTRHNEIEPLSSLLELVRLPYRLYPRLYGHPDCRIPARRHRRGADIKETEPSIRLLIGPFLLARVEHLFGAGTLLNQFGRGDGVKRNYHPIRAFRYHRTMPDILRN